MDHLVDKMAKSSRRGIGVYSCWKDGDRSRKIISVPYLDRVLNQVHEALNQKSRRDLSGSFAMRVELGPGSFWPGIISTFITSFQSSKDALRCIYARSRQV